MSLIIATGTNQGNKLENLSQALFLLEKNFILKAKSQIYKSKAISYTAQPNFYNQVLEFRTPSFKPEKILTICQKIEKQMGRIKNFKNGPRIIDIDIIFINSLIYKGENLEIPHPRTFERSFVISPLKELPAFSELSKKFNFSKPIHNSAKPINDN